MIAARSKAKAKPQPRESSGTTTISLSERVWIDIVPSRQDNESHKVSKRVINILRHNQNVNREPDGAVQFYKIKFLMRDHTLSTQNWSDNRWLACLAAGGGPKRRFQYCPDYLGSIIYLRALQGHSGDNIIDLEMQDHVLITPGIFPYIYHVGSNFSIPSILSNGLIPERSRIKRQDNLYISCLLTQGTKIIKIQKILIILCRVVLDTCKNRGKGIRTQYSGLILIMESSKKE